MAAVSLEKRIANVATLLRDFVQEGKEISATDRKALGSVLKQAEDLLKKANKAPKKEAAKKPTSKAPAKKKAPVAKKQIIDITYQNQTGRHVTVDNKARAIEVTLNGTKIQTVKIVEGKKEVLSSKDGNWYMKDTNGARVKLTPRIISGIVEAFYQKKVFQA